jgi:hypothetical protein
MSEWVSEWVSECSVPILELTSVFFLVCVTTVIRSSKSVHHLEDHQYFSCINIALGSITRFIRYVVISHCCATLGSLQYSWEAAKSHASFVTVIYISFATFWVQIVMQIYVFRLDLPSSLFCDLCCCSFMCFMYVYFIYEWETLHVHCYHSHDLCHFFLTLPAL